MKNRNFYKTSIITLLPLSMTLGVLFGIQKPTSKETSAYSSQSLPTTIDLNDCTTNEIKNYYSTLTNKSESDLQGNNLLANLKTILKTNQKYYKYDGGSLWSMYEITDRDWVKSPASSITYGTYNSSTNIISDYQYGTSTSNSKNNPYIHALYVDRSVENLTKAWGDHQQTQWGINQEHIWPKSQGFNETGEGGARGDPMHLWAGNGRVNGTEHNNNMYGFVDKTRTTTDPYTTKGFANLKDNYSGYSSTLSTSDTVFEPQDSDKGDIARAIFYMVARYNNVDGTDNSIDQNNPNLSLKQTTEALSSYTTTNALGNTGYMGIMTDLLIWNHLDPVDDYEIHRNNLLYKNYTNNRNPFIDYPEWADYIWGKPNYNGRNFISYSSTPTGFVDLTSDVVNGFRSDAGEQKTISSIAINTQPTKTTYTAGESFDSTGLTLTATYTDLTTETISSGFTYAPTEALTTSDTSITITYRGKTTTCSIIVNEASSLPTTTSTAVFDEKKFSDDGTVTVGDLSLTLSDSTNTYYYDSTYGKGQQIGKASEPTSSFTISTTVPGTVTTVKVQTAGASGIIGTVGVTVGSTSFTCNNSTTASISMYNTEYVFTGRASGTIVITWNQTTSKAFYVKQIDVISEVDTLVSEISLNKSSLSLDNGSQFTLVPTISPSNATVKALDWSSSDSSVVSVLNGVVTAVGLGSATVTCSATDSSGVTATCFVSVLQPLVLESITLSGTYETTFNVGDEFSHDGLVVIAHYYRGSTEDSTVNVTNDSEFDGYDMTTAGTQIITVTYNGEKVTYQITVKTVVGENTIVFDYQNQSYENGNAVSLLTVDDFKVKFVKNSGTTPTYYTSGNAVRLYNGNSIEITGPKKIVAVSIEFSGDNTITPNSGTYNNGTWTGSATDYLVLNIGTGTSHLKINSISVKYDPTQNSKAVLSYITLSGTYKTQFFTGDAFNSEGLIVTAHYADNSTETVVPTTISTPSMTYSGTKTITVSYTERGETAQVTYDITVSANSITGISLSGSYKTAYEIGDAFEFGGTVNLNYANGTSEDVTSSASFSGYDMSKSGDYTVTVTYQSYTATYTITVASASVPTKSKVFAKVNSLADINSTSRFIIGYEVDGELKYLPNAFVNSTFLCSSLTITNSKVTDENEVAAIQFSDVSSITNSSLTLKITDGSNYLNSYNSTSGNFKTSTTGENWTVTIINGAFSFINENSTSRSILYRSSTGRIGNYAISNVTSSDSDYFYPSLYKEITNSLDETSYSLIKDPNEIRGGDEVLLVGVSTSNNQNSYFAATTINNKNILGVSEVTINADETISSNDNLSVFSVERTGNYVRFNSSNGYIAAYSTTDNKCCYETSTPSNKSLFSLEINSTTGNVESMCAQDNTTNLRKYFRFNYLETNSRFSCYSSADASFKFSIYKKTTQVVADTWSKSFIESTNNCNITNWNSLSVSYSNLPSNIRTLLVNTVADSSVDSSYRAQAMARYDYIVSDARYDVANFISARDISSSKPNIIVFANVSKDSSVVILFSLIGASSICCFVLIKRKRSIRWKA